MTSASEARPVLVRLPPLIATLYPNVDRLVALKAATVSEVIDGLDDRWPGMRDCFCDSSPAIRQHINVFVEGRRVGLDAVLAPGTDVYILTAISGG
jgi:molybdopterin synthase sulfur carrier subunit